MKTLVILRHAKAQPDAPRGDHARTLTARGERDAAAAGRIVAELVGVPDAIVTSDAARARQTAEIAAGVIGFEAPLTIEPSIYDADVDDLLAVVRALSDTAARVVIVGHNPGFADLAAALAEPRAVVGHLRTAGIAHLEFAAASWREIGTGTGRLRGLATGRGEEV
jgi:phosphohistidine phosphatase